MMAEKVRREDRAEFRYNRENVRITDYLYMNQGKETVHCNCWTKERIR